MGIFKKTISVQDGRVVERYKFLGMSIRKREIDESFFPEGYLFLYPDVEQSKMTPWEHYVKFGKKEGRGNGLNPPKDKFSPEGYLLLYPDVRKSGMDPWKHYVLHGRTEGRGNGLTPLDRRFFAEGYLLLYPEVRDVRVSLWKHYVQYGSKEGKSNGLVPPPNQFWADGYLIQYPDVRKSGMDPWKHYVLYGLAEGRSNGLVPAKDRFSAEGYLRLYPDVRKARVSLWKHYVQYGWKEGRCNGLPPSAKEFFPEGYLFLYPDVEKSGIDPWEHYIKFGKKEHRSNGLIPPNNRFSSEGYLRLYPDVRKAKANPWKHYVLHGFAEGRRNGLPPTALETHNRNLIFHSEYFNLDWYHHSYPWVGERSNDAALDCLRNGMTGARSPGPDFYANEYLIINPDVREAGIHPVLHYERYGWKEGRAVSLADIKKPSFPDGAEEIEKVFSVRQSRDNRVVSVVASYSGNGLIDDYVVYLLEGLKEISDYIIFVSDNPIYPDELDKIKNITNVCLFKRHEEYDFGSYKYGFLWLQEHNILEENDNLLFVNDSLYGPVYPFSNVVKDYFNKNVDFYGLTITKSPRKYINSFFYIFNRKVYDSIVFKEFLLSVKKELSAAHVICNYEFMFTKVLEDNGFRCDSFIPEGQFDLTNQSLGMIPTKFGLSLLRDWKFPLVKIKVLLGSSIEKSGDILQHIKDNNHDLYKAFSNHLGKRMESIEKRKKIASLSKYTLYGQYRQSEERLREKVASGGKIRCVFLVNLVSMFAAENLMVEMLRDSENYEVELYAIPEIRFGDEEMLQELDKTYQALKGKYPFVRKAVDVENSEIVSYNDVIAGADIVCYPSPYNVSYSLYNPYHAAKQGILSIHINYGFFRSKYDRIIYRMENYNNFWKVFLETEYNMEEYRRFGQCDGANAVLTGYAKMDRLAQYQKQEAVPGSRKKVIIAPHHSVQGGMNAILALSNFERYADLFLSLPEKYPEVDFIFRPHPALFPVLARENKWGREKVDAYLDKMRSYGNVTYSDGGDYMQVFADSDAIIQDSGSFLVEYLYTGKPCCYLLKEEKDIEDKFVELGKRCLDCCYVSYTEEEINRFMEDVVIGGKDEKQSMRDAFRREVLMVNYPDVSGKISGYIKEEILGKKA